MSLKHENTRAGGLSRFREIQKIVETQESTYHQDKKSCPHVDESRASRIPSINRYKCNLYTVPYMHSIRTNALTCVLCVCQREALKLLLQHTSIRRRKILFPQFSKQFLSKKYFQRYAVAILFLFFRGIATAHWLKRTCSSRISQNVYISKNKDNITFLRQNFS